MEIKTVLKRLHEVHKKTNPALGCVSRTYILYRFMKSKGLNPDIKLFSFKNDKSIKVINSHTVVTLKGMVYDINIEPTKNPIEFVKYEKIKRSEHPQLNLVWEDWENSNAYRGTAIDDIWKYLVYYCDEELQKEIIPIIKEEYKLYVKQYPWVENLPPSE